MIKQHNGKAHAGRFSQFARGVLIAILLCLVSLPAISAGGSGPPSNAVPFYFKDFNGVNYMPQGKLYQQMGIGWVRDSFYWEGIEWQKGKWNWAKYDKEAQTAQALHLHLLPMLGYTAPWARSVKGKDRSPAANVADWQEYVDKVVARYSAPPYNLRYFQVWNEPITTSGFWQGKTDMDFIDQVYLPAAKVIRSHHCYVVFGGWPLGGSLGEFDSELAHNNAWQWTDILDIHYRDVDAWEHLYDTWVKNGKCQGIWQTECGYTLAPNALPGLYIRSLAFALSKGIEFADQYKLFWFAWWGNGADAQKNLVAAPYNLSRHGLRLKAMNDLLGAGPLQITSQFSLQPSFGANYVQGQSYAGAFRVGSHRTVVALIFNGKNLAGKKSVSLNLTVPTKPASVSVVGVTGDRQNLPNRFSGSQLTTKVPLGFLRNACPQCAWVVGYVEADY